MSAVEEAVAVRAYTEHSEDSHSIPIVSEFVGLFFSFILDAIDFALLVSFGVSKSQRKILSSTHSSMPYDSAFIMLLLPTF